MISDPPAEPEPFDEARRSARLWAILERVIFEPTWGPLMRLLLIAVAMVALYLAVYLVTRM